MNYLVTYDLKRSGQNYDGLINAIEAYPHKHIMQSVWFIKSSLPAGEIFNHLGGQIDNNDSLLIIEVSSNRAGWIQQVYWDFLK